jgi:ribosomal protein S18 acetylase RimI-like enzyme
LGALLLYPYQGDPAKGEHPLNLYLHLDAGEGVEDSERVKDALLARGLERAVHIKQEAGQPAARVYACFFKHQEDQVAYFVARGFVQDESMVILERDTAAPLPSVGVPPGFTLRVWEMESDREKDAFINTHRQVFPRHPYSRRRLEELAASPSWRNYTTLHQQAIVGNIMVFSRQIGEERIGIIEDLFVLGDWRQQGVGRALLHAALAYFQVLEVPRVQLEMWSTNQPAYRLYQAFGFRVVDQTELAVGRVV